MAIIRWNPWNLSSMLDEDWDMPTIPGISRIMGQGLNIYETDKEIVAEVALPGIQDDHIDVSINEGVVRITAQSQTSQEEKDQRKYYMSSMVQNYNYSFRLPEGQITDKEPKAVLKNGVLALRFEKVQPVAPKKIKVVSEDKNSEIKTTTEK